MVGHVSRVDGLIGRGSGVQSWIWEWIITSLLARVAEVIRLGTISVEVVEEQTSTASVGRHHCAAVVTSVDKIDGVAVTGWIVWVRASCWELLDKVEETLIAVCSSGER